MNEWMNYGRMNELWTNEWIMNEWMQAIPIEKKAINEL